MADDVLSQTRRIIADTLGADDIAADASPDSVEAWDSFAHLNIVMALEQSFGVSFDPEEVGELLSPQAFADRVEAKR
ncbi:MAG: acyl carrier protein [Planctomycetota bacterium]